MYFIFLMKARQLARFSMNLKLAELLADVEKAGSLSVRFHNSLAALCIPSTVSWQVQLWW